MRQSPGSDIVEDMVEGFATLSILCISRAREWRVVTASGCRAIWTRRCLLPTYSIKHGGAKCESRSHASAGQNRGRSNPDAGFLRGESKWTNQMPSIHEFQRCILPCRLSEILRADRCDRPPYSVGIFNSSDVRLSKVVLSASVYISRPTCMLIFSVQSRLSPSTPESYRAVFPDPVRY